MSSKFKPGEGDWICGDPKCGNVNFSRRTQCNKCGRDKLTGIEFKKGGAEIGKELAEKSKGLFSADDWQCKTCGNVNWARRTTCNLCNAPKYGKIEPRTGLGGGYMERDEVVEYKERDDSDDEYDEFGRKKKKRGLSGGHREDSREQRNINTRKEEEKEEETADDDEDDDDVDASKYKLDSDEDEDDEDGDLSKYNLTDDEDKQDSKKKEDDGPKQNSSSGPSSKRSRSRSRSPPSTKKSRQRSRSSSDSDY